MTVHDVGHLAAAGRVVRDDDEVVDGAARQVVVHQTDGAVGRPRRATAATTLAGRLEVHHGLQVRATHASYSVIMTPDYGCHSSRFLDPLSRVPS